MNYSTYSQITYSFKSIANNSNTTYIDSLKKSNDYSVVFFCPTNEIDSSLYIKNGKLLVTNKKISAFNSIKVHFILFKEDPKNNSKGIILTNRDASKSFPIGQLECFFLNFDNKLVNRAKQKDKYNFEYSHVFSNENIIRVQIVDTNKCFKEIPERIPFYADFIKEAFSPSYSVEEKIEFLNDSIRSLSKNLMEMKTLNEQILQKVDSILIDNQKQTSKITKVEKTDKPVKENTNKNQPLNPAENKQKDAVFDSKLNEKNKIEKR